MGQAARTVLRGRVMKHASLPLLGWKRREFITLIAEPRLAARQARAHRFKTPTVESDAQVKTASRRVAKGFRDSPDRRPNLFTFLLAAPTLDGLMSISQISSV